MVFKSQTSFIGWLAMLNTFSTKERMLKWGFNGDTKCVLCRDEIDNREHHFFECSFSQYNMEDSNELVLGEAS